MIDIQVPGHRTLTLEHLVLDYNGTLAVDGALVAGVRESLLALSEKLTIHVVTADTFGKVETAMKGVPCRVTILPLEDQDKGKLAYIRSFGYERVVACGNGRNDQLMIEAAALGIAVILEEGAAVGTLTAADVVFTDICHALAFLQNPLRVTATLRT